MGSHQRITGKEGSNFFNFLNKNQYRKSSVIIVKIFITKRKSTCVREKKYASKKEKRLAENV